MNESSFWDNKERADKVINEVSDAKKILEKVEEIKNKVKMSLETIELLIIEKDDELINLINNDYNNLFLELSNLEMELYLNGPYDENNCLLEIHPGAGGTESQDWAMMLYSMYTRFFKKKNWKYEEIYIQEEDVGIKSAMILVKAKNAYGFLKGERGVHRLVRISPFDSNSRRHTSFASVDIIPEIDNSIEIELLDKDLKIDVYRSSGAGGQSVNTTDSAVRITHIPSNIVVTVQNERSQIQNKEKALEILKSKLYALEQEKKEKELGNMKSNISINFGSQKRSYVMCPYTLVKDNDTDYEKVDVNSVLDGNLDDFINAYLRKGE